MVDKTLPNGDWISTREVSRILKCHTAYVYKLRAEGKISSQKEGYHRYYLKTDVMDWLSKRHARQAATRLRGIAADKGIPRSSAFAALDVSEVKSIAGQPDLLLLRHDIFMLTQTIQNLISSLQTR